MMRNWTPWILVAVLSNGLVGTALATTPVPSFEVKTTDGPIFNLAAQRGHVVIINYWATWCVGCIKEMPVLRDFAASHPDLRLIGLTFEIITPEELQKFLVATRPGFPIAHIDSDKIPDELKPTWFGLSVLPLTYVLSPAGNVSKRWVGEVTAVELEEAIGQLAVQ